MIIKFKSKDTWVVFGEVDHVEYRNMTAKGEDPKKMGISSDVILYEPADDGAVVEWFGMGFFTKNMTESTEIIACAPIYLMNDQGKTVETL
jgi:hypothetical protein